MRAFFSMLRPKSASGLVDSSDRNPLAGGPLISTTSSSQSPSATRRSRSGLRKARTRLSAAPWPPSLIAAATPPA
jgi:hypothetical protein